MPLRLGLVGGLCNRIRTFLGFLYVEEAKEWSKRGVDLAEYISNDKELPFSNHTSHSSDSVLITALWTNCDLCPGHFLDIFEPLSGVEFVTDKEEFTKGGPVHLWGQRTINRSLRESGIVFEKDSPVLEQIITYLYKKLVLKPSVRVQVDSYLAHTPLADCVGLHVRRSDHVALATQHGQFTSDEDFFEIMRTFGPQQIFYLATDNEETRETFLQAFEGRIVYYPYKYLGDSSVRQTSLTEAVLDLYLLSHCTKIFGSGRSSFSTCSKRLKLARG